MNNFWIKIIISVHDEVMLRARLQPPASPSPAKTPALDFSYLHQELKRKGVTLQLLWEEYCQGKDLPLSYSHFCLQYRQWRNQQPSGMLLPGQLHCQAFAFLPTRGPYHAR